MTERIGDFGECGEQPYSVLKAAIASNDLFSLNRFVGKLIFRRKIKKSKGKRILGQIKILGDLDRLISGVDFVIVVDYYFWNENPEKQEALLFHELCHLFVDEAGILSAVPHDIEEFYAVTAKYGDWLGDVAPLTKAVKQYDLFEIEDRIKAL
jgi:hypothetical protein